jgi:hypothetical protein
MVYEVMIITAASECKASNIGLENAGSESRWAYSLTSRRQAWNVEAVLNQVVTGDGCQGFQQLLPPH